MDTRITKLKSTTFFGQRLTRQQIATIQETVALFPALNRRELEAHDLRSSGLVHSSRGLSDPVMPASAGPFGRAFTVF